MLVISPRLPVTHGFSTREGGVSQGPFASLNLGSAVGDDPRHVEENARRLATRVGLAAGQLLSANQVHGDVILEVEPQRAPHGGEMSGSLGDADGLVTRTRGVAVCVRTADCVPVLLYAPDVEAVAAVHAGWRGSLLMIAAKAVAEMTRRWKANPRRMLAAIGPSIRRCCYAVGEEIAHRFEGRFGEGVVDRGPDRGHRLDLAEANRRALVGAGLAERNVDIVAHCTACEPETFFSHRRDQGRTGRHLSFVAMT